MVSIIVSLVVNNLAEKICEKRFILVTGKGGAGKSLLSMALAHRLSEMGKRVWLVEIGRRHEKSFSRLPELFNATITHERKLVDFPDSLSCDVSLLDPTRSLSEYIDTKLPTGGMAGFLLNNNVTASLLEVVPGLPEMVTMGKIWYTITNKKVADTAPDITILDGPATGHAIALLRSPENFKKLTKAGPIFRDSSQMVDFFTDTKLCHSLFLSLPEEMSLQETREFKKEVAQDRLESSIIVNKCFPEVGDEKDWKTETQTWKAYSYARERYLREVDALKNSGLKNLTTIPYFFHDDTPLYKKISQCL